MRWDASLSERKVLDYLVVAYPEAVTKEEIEAIVGFDPSYYLRKLIAEGKAERVETLEIEDKEEYERLMEDLKVAKELMERERGWLMKGAWRTRIRELERRIARLVRKVVKYRAILKVYYRTSYAEMYYSEKPRGKTPDPIAEVRVTVVSDEKGRYKEALKRMRDVCIYTMMIMAPQTWWLKQPYEVTAYEEDEMIDQDELEQSVPVYGRLNYAERYVVFFRSRRESHKWWRREEPFWWERRVFPEPEEGDYEYDEKAIKERENFFVETGVARLRFNNERCMLE